MNRATVPGHTYILSVMNVWTMTSKTATNARWLRRGFKRLPALGIYRRRPSSSWYAKSTGARVSHVWTISTGLRVVETGETTGRIVIICDDKIPTSPQLHFHRSYTKTESRHFLLARLLGAVMVECNFNLWDLWFDVFYIALFEAETMCYLLFRNLTSFRKQKSNFVCNVEISDI